MTSREVSRYLRAALALDIRIGTDGTKIVMSVPMKVPSGIMRAFERAIDENRAEFIRQITADTELRRMPAGGHA